MLETGIGFAGSEAVIDYIPRWLLCLVVRTSTPFLQVAVRRGTNTSHPTIKPSTLLIFQSLPAEFIWRKLMLLSWGE